MTTTSKVYGDYVVFVESKALRGRSKQEYLRQVRKLGEHYAGRELAGVTEREVFDYLVHRREVEKLRPSLCYFSVPLLPITQVLESVKVKLGGTAASLAFISAPHLFWSLRSHALAFEPT